MSELLEAIIQEAQFAEDGEEGNRGQGVVREFIDRVASEAEVSSKGASVGISEAVAQIDAEISRQLTEILHHPKFQALEGTWAGLNQFVRNTQTSSMLRLRVMHATSDELVKDLTSAVEFDQSHLFKQVYESEYGTLGGAPYSMLVLDYEFGSGNKDVTFMREIASVGAAAHAPVLASVSASFFGMGDYRQISNPRDMSRVLDSSEYAKWQSFRKTEDSRYLALTMPRVLARAPYGKDGMPVESFNFHEEVDGLNPADFVWTNSCWYLAQRITDAFSKYGWTAAIRGVEGGGMVDNLPVYSFKAEDGTSQMVCPTEAAITDRREKELSDLGFLPLVYSKNSDTAVFFGGQTTNSPVVYDEFDATANAAISARLPYILAASRFAHYFKTMLRDKVGSFETAESVQDYLQGWIGNYILLDDNASHEAKSRFPLREARVDVEEVPGAPGEYMATAYLRPHFQLEEISASIRLVANLPT